MLHTASIEVKFEWLAVSKCVWLFGQRQVPCLRLFESHLTLPFLLSLACVQVSDSKGGASLSALASGTFLYVAMMEVIPKELADSSLRIPKMLSICIGFGLMSLLAIWAWACKCLDLCVFVGFGASLDGWHTFFLLVFGEGGSVCYVTAKLNAYFPPSKLSSNCLSS